MIKITTKKLEKQKKYGNGINFTQIYIKLMFNEWN